MISFRVGGAVKSRHETSLTELYGIFLISYRFFLQDEATTKEKEDKEKDDSSSKEDVGGGQASRTLEERRRSMLDHHWAVPSKDRCSFSVDDEQQDSLNSEKVISDNHPSIE